MTWRWLYITLVQNWGGSVWQQSQVVTAHNVCGGGVQTCQATLGEVITEITAEELMTTYSWLVVEPPP